MSITVTETKLNLPYFIQGKVRDVYDLGDYLLIAASDRISCFDRILPTPIPEKGIILTQLSNFWFDYLSDVVPNHMVETGIDEISECINTPAWKKEVQENRDILERRTVLVKKVKRINIECVVRGYLAGSGWKEYGESESVCDIKLPPGMKESEKIGELIFTPSTKSEKGDHDINITEKQMIDNVGHEQGARLKELSLRLYEKASSHALSRGIIIADTKFEFGVGEDGIVLIDEALTPDSSRFWDSGTYAPGKSQDSYDKQFVRDYLLSIKWNKEPPVPKLPDEIVRKTQEKYLQAYEKLTGKKL